MPMQQQRQRGAALLLHAHSEQQAATASSGGTLEPSAPREQQWFQSPLLPRCPSHPSTHPQHTHTHAWPLNSNSPPPPTSNHQQVYPDKGTVSFSAGLHGWAFTLTTFAKMYASKFGTDEVRAGG